MFGPPPLTMKLHIFILCLGFLLPVQCDDKERYAYCETCLQAAREIEKAIKEAPPKSRHTVVESLIRGGVCDKLQHYKHFSVHKMTSFCMKLLESYYEQFRMVLLNKEPKHLHIVLCYEQSRACVGVKRSSFEDSKKKTFTESDIEALLEENKERVRFARPIQSGSPVHTRDEL